MTATKKVSELKVKESYIKKLERIERNHLKKYGYRTMSIEELDRLCRGGK